MEILAGLATLALAANVEWRLLQLRRVRLLRREAAEKVETDDTIAAWRAAQELVAYELHHHQFWPAYHEMVGNFMVCRCGETTGL